MVYNTRSVQSGLTVLSLVSTTPPNRLPLNQLSWPQTDRLFLRTLSLQPFLKTTLQTRLPMLGSSKQTNVSWIRRRSGPGKSVQAGITSITSHSRTSGRSMTSFLSQNHSRPVSWARSAKDTWPKASWLLLQPCSWPLLLKLSDLVTKMMTTSPSSSTNVSKFAILNPPRM